MNPEKARLALREGTDLLEKLGIRYWLGAGTALGAYRDGLSDEFLEKDTDIDVCTLDATAFFKFLYAAIEDGWTPHLCYAVRDRWVQCCVQKHKILFDLYLFYIDWEDCRCDTCRGTMRYPARMIDGDRFWIRICGKPYPVPRPIEEYLEVRFGPDWRTPAKEKIPWFEEAANLERQDQPQITFKARLHQV